MLSLLRHRRKSTVSRAKGTEERHLLPGGGAGIPAGPEPPLEGTEAPDQGHSPVRDLLNENDRECLATAQPFLRSV